MLQQTQRGELKLGCAPDCWLSVMALMDLIAALHETTGDWRFIAQASAANTQKSSGRVTLEWQMQLGSS